MVRPRIVRVVLLALAAGCGGDPDTDSGPREAEIQLTNVGTACLYGDELPSSPTDGAIETTFSSAAPVAAHVVLDPCASGCASKVTARCDIRIVTGEVVITAEGSYREPTGGGCPDVCVEVVATCQADPLEAGLWVLDYDGGHSDGFAVPGAGIAPCATSRRSG